MATSLLIALSSISMQISNNRLDKGQPFLTPRSFNPGQTMSFWDVDGNRKRTFLVLGPYCLLEFYSMGKRYLGMSPLMWMWLCEGKLKVKTAHFRLPFASQKRACLRWLNRVMQDHEARASDLNRKLIFSFFLLFSWSKLLNITNKGQNLLFNSHLWYQGF